MNKRPPLPFLPAILALASLSSLPSALAADAPKAAPGTAASAAPNSAQGAAAKPAAKAALTVTAIRPETTRLPLRLAANGNIMAWQDASVSSEAQGLRLTEVLANVGDTVRAGQVLAVFSAESVKADLAQAFAALAEGEANAANAIANADRARGLQASGAMSKQQIDLLLTAELAAKARIESLKAVVASQQLRLRHTKVLAPDHGTITARSATLGAVPGPGAELFRMIRHGRLEWRAEVTANELASIKPGIPATVTAVNGVELAGKVRMVGPTVDPASRAALVYVDLPTAPGATVKAGMFASGSFELGGSDALTLPQQAVTARDGFNYVFRLGPDQRVAQVKVRVGRRIGSRVELLDGIKADTQVVAAGIGFLHDGDMVKVVAGAAPSGAPATATATSTKTATKTATASPTAN